MKNKTKIIKTVFITIVSIIQLLFFVNNNVSAQEGTKSYPPQGSMAFRGLDDKSSPTQLADGRASALQNVKFTTTYALTKRDGYDLINDSFLDLADEDFAGITGIYYNKFSNAVEARVATCGKRLWRDSSSAWSLLHGATITAGNNYQFVWTTALDNIIGTNDVDVPIKISNVPALSILDVSDLTDTLTKAKCLIWFKNYLIFGNTVEATTERPTRFRWSNVGTIETYTDDDFIDIAALGGQEIEAFGVLYDSLYIFLTDSIWKVSLVGGDEIFVVSEVSRRIGCIAKNSIQNIELSNGQKGLAFLSRDKSINFFNGINIINLSLLIDTTMNSLSIGRLPYCVSAYDGSSAYWAVTISGTTNNLLLDFNTDIDEWTKHTDINANAMAKVIHSDSTEQIYFGNYDSAVYLIENSSLDSDVAGETGTVDAVDIYTTNSASGLQILYDASANLTDVTGATVKITAGSGLGEEKVIVYTTGTGIVVDSNFTTTPTATSTYEIGAIDAYYTTKWYDLGVAPRRKLLKELFLWTKEIGDMNCDVSYYVDFSGIIATQSVNLSGGGATWGSSKWGEAVWSGSDALFKRVKLKAPARYLKFKFAEDDIDETFQIYSWSVLFEEGDFY